MADFLLELYSEEIPARMQATAAKDLERLIVGALSDRGLLFEGARAFAGPRRLTLAVSGLPAKQPDTSEERKGPRTDAPQKAIDGFLRSAGVTLDRCSRQSDAKGEFYLAVIKRAGRATADVLAECLPGVMGELPWPKSMRWPGSAVRWVRPLHGIVCTFDGEVVAFEFAGVKSGNGTVGHRFLSQGEIDVRRFEDYEGKLRDAFVILDAAERKEIVRHEIAQKAFALGLEWIDDDALLDEVAGLAEWPVVLMGSIENQFMDVPPEILQTSMRTHLKYFALKDPKTGRLANRFAVVANMVASGGGKEIVTGNERVLRARLADAKFFWEQDRKRTLESRVDDLKKVVFHAKLGTQHERVERIEALAGEIAGKIGADPTKAKRAAHLCKADLTTEVVGEFPELQGTLGRYYALADGEATEIADAIRDHYKPLGPNDEVPTAPVTAAVALADKLHSLVMFFGAGEKPKGSGDPYALRRSALGILRILLANGYRIDLVRLHASLGSDLLDFFVDRLKVALRSGGTRHDVIDAVFYRRDADFVRLADLAKAVQSFLDSEDGAILLAGYRRAVNIVRIEEKKDKRAYSGEPDPALLSQPEEKSLFAAIATARELIAAELERERFTEAMSVMAKLRVPVDAFFDSVIVNTDDPKVRINRLLLLSRLRDALHTVADFSKIEG